MTFASPARSRRALLVLSALGVAALGASAAYAATPSAAAKVGQPAPAFSATDARGKPVSLAALKGKTVVLEWSNHECPFVQKHYTGAMQALQKKWTGQGIVWLTVLSSAPGEQGGVSPTEANKLSVDRGAAPTDVVMDPKGELGRLYGARTTPDMYVITPDGTLAYMGAIDDKPSTNQADLKTARNYVDEALVAVTTGKPVAVSATRSYGCSIKYSS
ncbi:redoxin domain-containing protein [Chelatococcus reniformis]|uniref:Thioredoxin family protein n=1 Tax=Chelatococcus reniformis TaxID=1494448 RepID=A0A916U3H5_9HYPH|nr:redoxin domain-containing protein [Chelatococcus reniformis]GGC57934.1 thioredoxin family protein [Chelatococcus reniformis]